MDAAIHPSAIIESGAQVPESVRVGTYSLIERGAVVGPDCIIESCVRISGLTRLGRGNRICHGVTLGTEAQDLRFVPAQAKPLTIGNHNHFKENVNISGGFHAEAGTRIGSHNYFMAFSHVGHDCQVGDHNIFANGATLAGHVELAHHSFLSGQVAVHQFCRIGAYVLVAGVSGVPQDVPPFVIADGHRAKIVGINRVGLKRNGFSPQQRRRIQNTYRILFRSGLPLSKALSRAEASDDSSETRQILAFIRASQRGVLSHA